MGENFFLPLQLRACTRKSPGGNTVFRQKPPAGGITISAGGNTGTLRLISSCGGLYIVKRPHTAHPYTIKSVRFIPLSQPSPPLPKSFRADPQRQLRTPNSPKASFPYQNQSLHPERP